MEKKLTKKKIVLLCILAAVILALLVGVIGYICGWFDKGYDADVVTVQQRNITSTFDTSGTVSASKEGTFNIVSGVKVTKVNVQVGSLVKKGDVLAQFDSSSLTKTLNEKKSALDKAEKAYNDYKSSMASAKSSLSGIDKKISAAEKNIAELEKKAEQEKAQQKAQAQAQQSAPQETQKAQDNLASVIGDSTLAGKIIDSIVSSSKSLQQLKSMMDSISSMSDLSQMSSIMGSMGGSSEYELMQAQVELASLKMSKMTAESQANGSLEDVYKSVYESALSGYNSSKEAIDALNAGWVAEFDGVVSEVNIKEGETVKAPESQQSSDSFDVSSIVGMISSGSDISSLVGNFFKTDTLGIKVQYYPLEISFMLSKGDLSKVSVGQKVKVKTETGSDVYGRVSFIAAVASTSSSFDMNALLSGASGSAAGIEAKVTVDTPDSGIIIGLDADISIDVEEKTGIITVPVESIQYDDQHAFLYVYNPDEKTISKKMVETGIFDGTYYEVLSGIEAGEIIIRTPVATMKEGDKVIPHNVDNK